jgi:hypothetical protein
LFSIASFLEFIDNLMSTYVQPNIEFAWSTVEDVTREYGLRNIENAWNAVCEAKDSFSVDKSVELILIYALRAFFLPLTIGIAISKFWLTAFASVFNFVWTISLAVFEAVAPQRVVDIVFVLDDAARGIAAFFAECFEDYRFGKASKEQIWNRTVTAASDGCEDVEALFNDGTLIKSGLTSLQIPNWLRMLKLPEYRQKFE